MQNTTFLKRTQGYPFGCVQKSALEPQIFGESTIDLRRDIGYNFIK